ncbi:MAG: hypothetical protein EOO75_10125, partial [Myxococcales bacterium]
MSAPRRRPAEHVRVPLSGERTERIWRRLDASSRRRSRGPLVAVVAAVAAAAAALVAVRAGRDALTPAAPSPTVAIVA